MNLCLISISAYRTHVCTFLKSTSIVLSYTDLALWISFWLSSHLAYRSHVARFEEFPRRRSSKSLRTLVRCSASSSTSATCLLGGGGAACCALSFASRTICSAVIWIDAGARFFTTIPRGGPRDEPPPELPGPSILCEETARAGAADARDARTDARKDRGKLEGAGVGRASSGASERVESPTSREGVDRGRRSAFGANEQMKMR
jgi:hypothetical protein